MSHIKPLEKPSGAFVEAPGKLRTLGAETDIQSTRGRTGSEGRGAVENPTIHIVADEANKKPAPWTAEAVEKLSAGYSREIAWREADAYRFGFEDGRKVGRREVEEDFDRRWAVVARQVRDLGRNGSLPHSERRRRELEWAKPRPGDFTGRLTPEEYFRGCAA